MNGGMRSSPGPHCHAARNTISSATLAAVPLHTTEEFVRLAHAGIAGVPMSRRSISRFT